MLFTYLMIMNELVKWFVFLSSIIIDLFILSGEQGESMLVSVQGQFRW